MWPHDAGTELRTGPGDAAPGLDLGRYIHAGGAKHWEHYFYEVQAYTHRVNQTLRDGVGGTIPFRSWNPGMPRTCWVDYTNRYETIEGFYWKLHQRDQITDSYGQVPAAWHVWLDLTYEPPIIDAQEKVSDLKTPSEVALEKSQEGEDPTQYVRAPLQNETEYHGSWKGYTHLKNPIACTISGVGGNNVVLEIPNDQLLFAPQDWRYPEWYKCFNINGEPLEPTSEWLSLRRNGKYRVHIRPRMWRWTIFVLAHYIYVTLWGLIPNDEYFTHVFFDRPPFYPWRHDVITTKASSPVYNWNNQARSYDLALDYHWEHTNAAADLSRQIIEQQYSMPSMVYLFLSNEDPDLFLEAWPSYKGDIVAVIERIDEASGSEGLVFVQQSANLLSYFPKFQFGAFLARWRIDNPRY
jgi:hypothetical protein